MFMLVLITCVTLEGQTVCHEFPRDHQFMSLLSCKTAGAIERGRYQSRISARKWARYDWNCVTQESVAHASASDDITPDKIGLPKS